MRSRDGNSYFSCSIPVVLLLLITPFALIADEYLISYRYLVKNATLYNETLQVSKAMKPCKGVPYKPLRLESRDDKNFSKLLKDNEEFISYIHKLGLHVSHQDATINYVYTSLTELTLKTTCFKVDFNDSFVKISPLK